MLPVCEIVINQGLCLQRPVRSKNSSRENYLLPCLQQLQHFPCSMLDSESSYLLLSILFLPDREEYTIFVGQYHIQTFNFLLVKGQSMFCVILYRWPIYLILQILSRLKLSWGSFFQEEGILMNRSQLVTNRSFIRNSLR